MASEYAVWLKLVNVKVDLVQRLCMGTRARVSNQKLGVTQAFAMAEIGPIEALARMCMARVPEGNCRKKLVEYHELFTPVCPLWEEIT